MSSDDDEGLRGGFGSCSINSGVGRYPLLAVPVLTGCSPLAICPMSAECSIVAVVSKEKMPYIVHHNLSWKQGGPKASGKCLSLSRYNSAEDQLPIQGEYILWV